MNHEFLDSDLPQGKINVSVLTDALRAAFGPDAGVSYSAGGTGEVHYQEYETREITLNGEKKERRVRVNRVADRIIPPQLTVHAPKGVTREQVLQVVAAHDPAKDDHEEHDERKALRHRQELESNPAFQALRAEVENLKRGR